jgi:hypothetical protein
VVLFDVSRHSCQHIIELSLALHRGESTSSEDPYPGVSTKVIFRSNTSPILSLLASTGRVFVSRSFSDFHHVGYARVLALISRMSFVGGMTFVSSVLRRDKEGFKKEEELGDVDDVAG